MADQLAAVMCYETSKVEHTGARASSCAPASGTDGRSDHGSSRVALANVVRSMATEARDHRGYCYLLRLYTHCKTNYVEVQKATEGMDIKRQLFYREF